MTILYIIISILLLLLFTSKEETEENNVEILFKPEDTQEYFYHPVTGYKGTKSEMDTYIRNRERKNPL